MADRVIRYFITLNDGPEEEVSKEKFVRAERDAGFWNTLGQPDEPATGGFSVEGDDYRVTGSVRYS